MLIRSLLPLTFLLANCSEAIDSDGSGDLRRTDHVLEITGRIDDEMVTYVKAHMSDSITAVLITSKGGDGASAIELGNIIHAAKIGVIVKDYCLSACAHFIFVAGEKKKVLPASIVAFHGTTTARRFALGRSPFSADVGTYTESSQKELSFYRKIKLDNELLTKPFLQIQPMCVAKDDLTRKVFENGIGFVTRASFYIPTRASLEQFGVKNIVGYWPAKASDVQKIASSFFPELTFAFETGSSRSMLPAKLPACIRKSV